MGYAAICNIYHHRKEKPKEEKSVANSNIRFKDSTEVQELKQIVKAMKIVLDMVEDNTKMSHQHTDPQLRLYCLAERANQVLTQHKDLLDKV